MTWCFRQKLVFVLFLSRFFSRVFNWILVWCIECCCVCHQGQICKKADTCLNLYPCVIKYYLILSYLSLPPPPPFSNPSVEISPCGKIKCDRLRWTSSALVLLTNCPFFFNHTFKSENFVEWNAHSTAHATAERRPETSQSARGDTRTKLPPHSCVYTSARVVACCQYQRIS